MGFVSEGARSGLARLVLVVVVLPCALYFVLGPALFGAIASLLYPHPTPSRPGYCPRCEYDLRGNADPTRCPECGQDIPSDLRSRNP